MLISTYKYINDRFVIATRGEAPHKAFDLVIYINCVPQIIRDLYGDATYISTRVKNNLRGSASLAQRSHHIKIL